MKLISNDLEVNLQYQEKRKDDIVSARYALEKALIYQFRQLSKGLFAFALLKELPTCSRKMFYLSQEDDISMSSDELLTKYMENLLKDAITNKFSVIQLNKLNDIDIRIYNRYVKLWDTMEINEQLAQLGSSLRLFFAGIEDLAVSRIGQIIGMESNRKIDARFILGNIGEISSTYCGEVFDFIDEKAISPFLDDSALGFAIEDIIVIRRCLINQTLSETDDDKNFTDKYTHTFMHEFLHSLSYSLKLNLPFGSFLWEKYMERDLLRYLQNPRSKTDIEKYFSIMDYIGSENICNRIPVSLLEKYKVYDTLKQFPAMEDILNSMIGSGKVQIVKNAAFEERFINNIHKEGEKWNLS